MNNDFTAKSEELTAFIRTAFPDSLKSAGGCLNHPYITPGGPYATTLWDWDSYWTTKAIIGICRAGGDTDFLQKIIPYAKGTFWNFLEHQGLDGALPIMLNSKIEDAFGSLADQNNNMAKPFIAQYGKLLLDNDLLTYQEIKSSGAADKILKFHRCYEMRYLDQKTGLVYWAKDWGIGVDDDPATWGRPEKSSASVFLNVFLYLDYLAAADIFKKLDQTAEAEEYQQKIARLKASIQQYCWDTREKAFFSVDIQCHQNLAYNRLCGKLNVSLQPFWNCLKLKVLSWSSILPFYAGIGTPEQFKEFYRENMTAERLYSLYGIRSLSKDEPMYSPEVRRGNPSNWLGPIWMITNFISWETFHKYSYHAEADRLAETMINLLHNDLKQNGMLHEYYSPESGAGVCGENFMSWNALAGLFTI